MAISLNTPVGATVRFSEYVEPFERRQGCKVGEVVVIEQVSNRSDTRIFFVHGFWYLPLYFDPVEKDNGHQS